MTKLGRERQPVHPTQCAVLIPGTLQTAKGVAFVAEISYPLGGGGQ
jgi:hypothetical protein